METLTAWNKAERNEERKRKNHGIKIEPKGKNKMTENTTKRDERIKQLKDMEATFVAMKNVRNATEREIDFANKKLNFIRQELDEMEATLRTKNELDAFNRLQGLNAETLEVMRKILNDRHAQEMEIESAKYYAEKQKADYNEALQKARQEDKEAKGE